MGAGTPGTTNVVRLKRKRKETLTISHSLSHYETKMSNNHKNTACKPKRNTKQMEQFKVSGGEVGVRRRGDFKQRAKSRCEDENRAL